MPLTFTEIAGSKTTFSFLSPPQAVVKNVVIVRIAIILFMIFLD
jgi:hypothetical protein